MGFFYEEKKRAAAKQAAKRNPAKVSKSLERQLTVAGCASCPMDKEERYLRNAKMDATGSERPLLYVLGEAPGREEDAQGEQFIGKAGKVIRHSIPPDFATSVRWNNSIRCHPPDNRDPTSVELACCRGYVEEDIVRTKPAVIVGTGNVPLDWALGVSGINNWRGRKIPVKIRTHTCWYLPVLHPSYIARKQRTNKRGKKITTEWDRVFDMDMRNAVEFAESPHVFDRLDYMGDFGRDDFTANVEWVYGRGESDYRKVLRWLDRIAQLDSHGLDLETTGIRPYPDDSRILTMAVGTWEECYAFPVDHPKAWNRRTLKKLWDAIFDFIMHSGRKVCHNLEFEMEWLAYFLGTEILRSTEWDDTMAMGYALDERSRKMLSLDTMMAIYFGAKGFKDLFPLDKANMITQRLEDVLPYNGADSRVTHELFLLCSDLLALDDNAGPRYTHEQTVRSSSTLVLSQLTGLVPDFKARDDIMEELQAEADGYVAEMQRLQEVKQWERMSGQKFSATNPHNVLGVLRDVCRCPEVRKDNGKFSTDEETLQKIDERDSKLPALILKFRGLDKIIGTYLRTLEKYVHDDGLIHTNYNSKLTSTQRLSSDDPNSQNYPKRKYRQVRKIVKAPEKHILCCFDYGQIQARGIAVLSEDQAFHDALWENLDIHSEWTQNLFDVFPRWWDIIYDEYGEEDDTDEKLFKKGRNSIKNGWVFPLFFGSSNKSCSENLHIPVRIADELAGEFWSKFRGVKKWHERLQKFYNRHGYVESPTGRRRRAPLGWNEMINSPVQLTEVDIVQEAMNRASEHGWDSCLNIHDDMSYYLQLATMEKDVDTLGEILATVDFDWFTVPLLVEVTSGMNWCDQKELKEFDSREFGHTRRGWK